jgi:hypothetical protein
VPQCTITAPAHLRPQEHEVHTEEFLSPSFPQLLFLPYRHRKRVQTRTGYLHCVGRLLRDGVRPSWRGEAVADRLWGAWMGKSMGECYCRLCFSPPGELVVIPLTYASYSWRFSPVVPVPSSRMPASCRAICCLTLNFALASGCYTLR